MSQMFQKTRFPRSCDWLKHIHMFSCTCVRWEGNLRCPQLCCLYSSSSSKKRPVQENSGLDQHVSFLLEYLSRVEVKFWLKAWKRTKLSLVYMHLGCSSFSQGFFTFIDLMFRIRIYYNCWYVWGVTKHADMFHLWEMIQLLPHSS